ncbi:uncharacterized protein LOC131931432 [Physella acuta]|uniref:uncharacterized protein LOC131931432 n=1 Tax=Physella acuta TaxID=109671 RepID=UPI0027DADA0F|nr:uncharacterized protein LOC131931432 [Physella acuta]
MAPPLAKKEKARKPSSTSDPWIGSRLVEGLRESIFMEYLTEKDVALVMFYDPKEGMCDWSKKHFLKAAKITERENHGYAAVDCTKEADVCENESVLSLPTFKLYSRGKVMGTYTNPLAFTYHTMARYVENAPVLTEPPRPKRPCDKD